ncbi:MAG: SpoIIE family protein phosphatase [Clostridia bacterium]|nr:SpoIIE family protein phosphatase [Clostridia bacterium]
MQESKKQEKTKSARRAVNRPVVKKETLLRMAKAALICFCAFLFSRATLPLDVRPFGLALLAAVPTAIPPVLVGILLAELVGGPDIGFLCVVGALALSRAILYFLWEEPKRKRTAGRGPKKQGRGKLFFTKVFEGVFSSSAKLRIILALAAALASGTLRCALGGFRYYDFFAVLLLLFATFVATLLFVVVLDQKAKSRILVLLSTEALAALLILGAKSLETPGFSVAVTIALFLSIYAYQKRGLAVGALTASVLGLTYGVLLSPAFLIALLLWAVFEDFKKPNLSMAIALAGFLAWAYFAGGILLFLRFLSSGLLAGAIVTVLDRYEKKEIDKSPVSSEDGRVHLAGERFKGSSDRFRGISDAFSSLSEMFYNLSDRFRRPGTLDLRQICDRSFDHFCPDCPNKTVCWGLEYSETLQTVNALISALHTKGMVTKEQIPEILSHRCPCMPEILAYMNRECAKLTGDLLRNNRTEIFAMDYESAADIIKDALEEDDGEYRFDPTLEKKVAEYLSDAGVSFSSVTVYGNRRRQILVRGVSLENAKITYEVLASDLGELLGVSFGPPILEFDRNVRSMMLQSKVQLSAAGAFRNISAEGGVSGDAINLFSNKKEYCYGLVCDGMGSGREAALTSNLCTVFLEKMLEAGNRAGTSLKMLNNMIRSRGADSTSECSSTVDLVEIDLVLSQAIFMKSGAAPSFLVRDGAVIRLEAGTAPIGIIRALDVHSEVCRLSPGDTIVLLSDGILEHDPKEEWILSYLKTVSDRTPEEISNHICQHAASFSHHDDCSALAIRISKKE